MAPNPDNSTTVAPEPEPEAEAEAYRYTVISLHFLWALATILLNVLLIFTFLCKKKLTVHLSTPYMVSILFAGLLVGLIAVPFGVAGYFTEEDLVPSWLCAVAQYVSHLALLVIILTLASHSIENLRFGLFGKISGTALSLIVVWLIALVWAVKAPLTENAVEAAGSDVKFSACIPHGDKIEIDRHLRWLEFGLFIAAPSAIILVCNWLHRSHHDPKSEVESRHENPKKTVNLSLVLLAVFIICQVPLRLWYLARYLRPPPGVAPEPEAEPETSAEPRAEWDKDGMIVQSLLFLAYANAFVNPSVMLFMNRDVRNELCCGGKRRNSVESDHAPIENGE